MNWAFGPHANMQLLPPEITKDLTNRLRQRDKCLHGLVSGVVPGDKCGIRDGASGSRDVAAAAHANCRL